MSLPAEVIEQFELEYEDAMPLRIAEHLVQVEGVEPMRAAVDAVRRCRPTASMGLLDIILSVDSALRLRFTDSEDRFTSSSVPERAS